MAERPSETIPRSGNRYVGLRSHRLSRLEQTPNNQREEGEGAAQVSKRTFGPGQLTYMMSPLSDQIIEANEQLGSNYLQLSKPATGGGDCSAQPTTVQLAKQELDPLSGQVIRSCRGLVRVNRCEGYCGSSVQPSVKSPVGLKKQCFCCNEGSFRQVKVRLSECYSALNQQLIGQEDDPARSYMDLVVDEPSECKCRRCDGFI